MLQKMASAMEIPEDLSEHATLIEIAGNHKIRIENYVRMMEYSDSRLVIQCKCYRLFISGNAFTLSLFSKTELILCGNIKTIEFEK
ncbi:MAG: YabP/YqfC family sporulation protein [Muricoprocola sp.]